MVGPLPIRIYKENQWTEDQQTKTTIIERPAAKTLITEREPKINRNNTSIDWSPPINHETEEKLSVIKPVSTPKPTFYLKDAPIICNICKQPVQADEETTSCPSCGTRFHLKHFAEWVRQKGTCPYCSERIGMKF